MKCTRRGCFGAGLLEVLALEHLYHLEHHLYPGVPHQNTGRSWRSGWTRTLNAWG